MAPAWAPADPALSEWPRLLANWLRVSGLLKMMRLGPAGERRATCCRGSIALFELSAAKIRAIEDTWRPEDGAPVFTVQGRYQARGWTEWTQGFQFGSALLQFDATGDRAFLELGRSRTVERMAPHLTHMGVHDHGFNNVSTYGNLWRLAREGRIDASDWERALLRAGAEGQRRGAGAALDARCPTAASSTRSTARTRCSSTRSARCARSRSATCSASR